MAKGQKKISSFLAPIPLPPGPWTNQMESTTEHLEMNNENVYVNQVDNEDQVTAEIIMPNGDSDENGDDIADYTSPNKGRLFFS